ncbi:unnamed protein product [Psylliodes chrysocephalus]|uniref:Uncharacterized protein n=1 Tax=Psylliodes chrysocephalus TaxID=3402493 RepID=A0A9P0GHI2_9CUCU|nr:unnamed protein product [Psylliodes chrysocephala]
MPPGNISNDLSNSQLYDLLIKAIKDQTEVLMSEINTNIQDLSKKAETVDTKVCMLQDKLLVLERKCRRNNVIIFGLKVDESNLLNNTLDLLNNIFGPIVSKNDINNIYIGGQKQNKQHIILEITSYLKKQELFKNTAKLKNSGVAIANDMPYEDRKVQRVLKVHLRNAKRQNHQARIRGNKLEIDGKFFTLDDLRNLEELASEDNYSPGEEEEEEAENEQPHNKKNKRQY